MFQKWGTLQNWELGKGENGKNRGDGTVRKRAKGLRVLCAYCCRQLGETDGPAIN